MGLTDQTLQKKKFKNSKTAIEAIQNDRYRTQQWDTIKQSNVHMYLYVYRLYKHIMCMCVFTGGGIGKHKEFLKK